MSALNINLDAEPELCKWCNRFTVQVTDTGSLVCVVCGRDHGECLVNAYREFSSIRASVGRYCKKKYRQKNFDLLAGNNEDCIPPANKELLDKYVKDHRGELEWKVMKKFLPQKFPMKAKCIYALPRYLGFDFDLHHSWKSMVEVAIKADKGKSKLNNLYALYQCVKLCGYYTDWIPIHLTKVKQRQFNRRWVQICERLDWEYHPMELQEFVDMSVTSSEVPAVDCAYLGEADNVISDMKEYDEDMAIQNEYAIADKQGKAPVECSLTFEQRAILAKARAGF